jgi:hypothetical protein
MRLSADALCDGFAVFFFFFFVIRMDGLWLVSTAKFPMYISP